MDRDQEENFGVSIYQIMPGLLIATIMFIAIAAIIILLISWA